MTAVVVGVALVQQLVTHTGDRAAFTGGNMLGFLETETAQVGQRATMPALVLGEPGLTGILNHRQLVLAGDDLDWVHVARHSENVHRHDGPSSFGDSAFDRGGIDRKPNHRTNSDRQSTRLNSSHEW